MTPLAISPSEKWSVSKVPVDMDRFSMITMLLRAAVTLRHRNEDLTLWAFRPTHSSSHISKSDSKFTTLEAFNAVLTPNGGVVAACYHDEELLVVPHAHKEGCSVDHPVLDSENQKYMMPCHIVVMANADNQTNSLGTQSNPLNPKFIINGEDLWPKIKESQASNYDPLDLVARGESVSLGSHAKTVCSYLNDFKATSCDLEDNPKHDDELTGYGRKFFNYLLSFCWEKLHRRFTSWIGLGFVYHLELTWLQLEIGDAINEYSQWESFNIPHTGDKSLTRFLKRHDFIPPVLDAILVRGTAFGTGSFSSLIQAVQEEQPALFTKNTAKDFHRLVLGTFIVLTVELELFKTHYRNWKQLDANVRNTAMQSFRRIGLYTHLLLNILASTSFRTYMIFMAQGGVKNLVPVFKDRLSYDAKWKLRKRVLMGGSWKVAPAEGEIANAEEPELDVDLEVPPQPSEDDVSVLIRGIRGFLLQFIGKRHLEQKCKKMHAHFPKSTIEIAVMTIDPIHCYIPPWSEFKSLIDDALRACPERPENYNASFVVASLLEEFGKDRKSYPRSIAYIDHFRKLIDYEIRGESSKGKLRVALAVHCEAALVALSQFPEAFKESKDIGTLKLNSSMVVIPKICCPVCWELITLLRNSLVTNGTNDSSPRLAIRGSHPHIYPLVLPPCISDEIREKMNLKFLGYLGSELVQLMAILDDKQGMSRPAKAKASTEAVDKKIVYHHQLNSGPILGSTMPGSASRNHDSGNAGVLSRIHRSKDQFQFQPALNKAASCSNG